jgi:glycosyltransferase involved in cell wall biosynthesis
VDDAAARAREWCAGDASIRRELGKSEHATVSVPTFPTISLIVPTYQRRASIERLLEALALQTVAPSEFEVIVSIDGSEDGTRETVNAFASRLPVRSTWHPNRGRAAARNAGIRASRGELLVLLDDDMEPAPGFVAAHLAAHADGAERAVLGAVPVMVDEHSPPPATFIKAKFDRHDAKLAQPGYQIGFRDFYTGNVSLRRDVLDVVGAFDEGFAGYGNEDGEFGYRLIKAGVEIVYSRDAAAFQHYEKDFAALAQDNLAKGQTAVLTVRRHPETFASMPIAHVGSRSRKRWLLREMLLRLTRVVRGTPRAVVWVVTVMERRRSPRLHRYYRIALDYFFWLGAQPLLEEQARQ